MRLDAALARVSVAGHRRDDLIPVGQTTRDAAGSSTTELPTSRLVAQIGQSHLRHGSHDANVHLGQQTDARRMNLDPLEGKAIEQIGDVSELATKPVDGLANHHFEIDLLQRP